VKSSAAAADAALLRCCLLHACLRHGCLCLASAWVRGLLRSGAPQAKAAVAFILPHGLGYS